MRLAVELYGERLGELIERRGGFDFVADPQAVAAHGIGSRLLSVAVPLTTRARPADAALRRNFFDELLPEGRARTSLAGRAGVTADYTIGMLARYGRDVAGALRIWDPEGPDEPRKPEAVPIDDLGVEESMKAVRAAPLGNSTARRMSSLAGVQDKIVLARTASGWAEPLDGFPSTHIIKPILMTMPTLIFDEEYGSRIARHLGLLDYATEIRMFGRTSALVIERYDRDPDSPDGRIHQEDFNQALGMSGDGKYQDDGHPGLAAIARVVRQADTGSLAGLAQMMTLSAAVGNLDMHAKNLSLLHRPDGSMTLAPAYDIVPQLHQDVDPVVALHVDGVRQHRDLRAGHLIAEARSWGLRDADELVGRTIAEISGFVATERPHAGAAPDLAHSISAICAQLLDDAPASRPEEGTDEGDPPLRYLPESPGGWGGPVRR
ncbi:type II toxin-antitoxin system HipA family toxin [Clavibacter nebraskensis]|uniref:HipA domain-containing protein n=2 Tax=Clavibacter nebraskensis TaxID=31963 RepID=A0A399Q083_9MICO|nr:HipA domain-containing protein [Clavibacter nebraskensis]KXU21585.1 toxin-antitoxin system, toxin component [Clavibacter nebraskensis]OAH18360.1 toxin-antitoxin system, toxin component [Clavibacter nebraskensis]QGV65906.1 HipA domain-containing protein [Clavibacter nebraskensis]QGV68703.1 HipA domain-containing protein [Clavibacter nebraskensis]QGV71494.1 HipA domain-containing protein [Clavibacter nebraskensis]